MCHQGRVPTPQQRPDVVVGGIVISHVIEHPLVAAVIDHRKHAEGTSIHFISGHRARKIRQCPVKEGGVHARLRLFSPSLPPLLDRGKGHKHAVVPPQVPAGGTVGQALFDDKSHRQIDHAMGVLTPRGARSERSVLQYC